MAAPIYATDLVDIYTDTSAGNAVLVSSGGGGQNALTDPESDDYIQGGSSISRNPWSSSIRGIVYTAATAQTIAAGDVVFIWAKADVSQALSTKAIGGIQALIGNASTALNAWYVDGSDSYTFGGWKCYPIDPTITPDTTIGTPTTATQSFGVRWNVPATGPSKGFPFKIDAIRSGRAIEVTDGDLANGYSTFLGAADFQGVISRQWGLFQFQDGTYLHQGLFRQGTSTTSVDFRDSNRVIFIAATDFVSADFNGYEINNASSNILWNNISISALGTVSRGNFVINNNATVLFNECTFNSLGTFSLGGTNTTIQGSTFRGAGLITLNGSNFTNNTINTSISSTSVITTTLNDITGCNFVSDGSNHAVELTSLGGGSMIWDNTTSGYAGTNGVSGNETLFINVGSGLLTINVTAAATSPTYRTAGASVTIVAGAVDFKFTVQDTSGNVIPDARVFVQTDTGGPLPYQASVSITRSGTVATVSHSLHGLENGDEVVIRGVEQREYFGIKVISNVSTNAYDFTVSGTPITPATGTINSSYVLLNGVSDVNGLIQGTKTFTSNQPITGQIRKSSASPYYKTGVVVGTINSGTGLISIITLLSDE
jgi:hypothetical protein